MFSSKNLKTNNDKLFPISKTTSLFNTNKPTSTTKSTGISNINPNKYLSSTASTTISSSTSSTSSSTYQYKSSTSTSSSWSSVQRQQSNNDQKTSIFSSSTAGRNGVSSINKNAIEPSLMSHYKSPYLKEGTHIRPTAGGLIEGNKYTPSYISPYRSNTIENQNQNDIKQQIWNPASTLTYPAKALLSGQISSTSISLSSSPKIETSISNKNKINVLQNNGLSTTTATTSNTNPLNNNNKSVTNSANTSSSAWWKPSPKNPSSLIKMRGYIMIFNQEKFKDKTMNREGSRKDEEALCRTFYNFGFNPMYERDLRVAEIKRKAKELSQKDFSNYGCIVIVVLSHGHEDETISAYDGEYNLNDILVHPIARNPTLSGKPKIFIISACKGAGRLIADNTRSVRIVTDAKPFTESTTKAPYTRDILKCYSTYEGYVSWRDPSKGTIFIQKLCDILNASGQTDTIENIIKTVNRELTEGSNQNKQVPTIVSTMSQDFCFGQLKR